MLKSDEVDFIYFSPKGRLFYNENGDESGFGDGGLIAKLAKRPDLAAEDFSVMA